MIKLEMIFENLTNEKSLELAKTIDLLKVKDAKISFVGNQTEELPYFLETRVRIQRWYDKN